LRKCSANLKQRQPASNKGETPPEKGRRFPEKTRLIVWDVEAARYLAERGQRLQRPFVIMVALTVKELICVMDLFCSCDG
jgi:hypothetical protein